MKNQIFPAILSMALLASCSDQSEQLATPVNSADQINLNVYTGKKTSKVADAVVGTNFTNFRVYATSPNPDYNFTDRYKYVGGWGWDAGNHYWSQSYADYPMTFFALGDGHKTDYALTDLGNGKMSGSFTILDDPDQVDLVAAISSVNAKPQGGNIGMAFTHALSKIKFSFNLGDNRKLYLKQLCIANVSDKGTITLDSSIPGFTWTDLTTSDTDKPLVYYNYVKHQSSDATDESADEYLTSGVQPVVPTALYPATVGSALMLMPQTGDAWNLKTADIREGSFIYMVYRMTDSQDRNVVGFKPNGDRGAYYVGVALPLYTGAYTGTYKDQPAIGDNTLAWDPNTQYTYVITLGTALSTDGIVIDERYIGEDLNPIDGTQIHIPNYSSNNDDPSDGDPRHLDDPINFNILEEIKLDITIEPWTDPSTEVDVL